MRPKAPPVWITSRRSLRAAVGVLVATPLAVMIAVLVLFSRAHFWPGEAVVLVVGIPYALAAHAIAAQLTRALSRR